MSSRINDVQVDIWSYLIISSSATTNTQNEFDFRAWNYVIIETVISKLASIKHVCVDIDCTMSLIKKNWLLQQQSSIKVNTSSSLIFVREIDDKVHSSSNFVKLSMYISEVNVKESTMTQITQTFHLIDKLRVKMLINMNVIESEDEIIDLSARRFRLTCEVIVELKITSSTSRVDRAVRVHYQITVLLYSIMNVSVRVREKNVQSAKRDYVFHSQITSLNLDIEDNVLAHIVDVNIFMIQIRNVTKKSVVLLKNVRLEKMLNYTEKDCYATNLADAHLAVKIS